MSSRQDLINSLSHELEQAKPQPSIDLIAGLWLLFSSAYVVVITHTLGPIRANALMQLITEPRFALEMACGLVAVLLTTLIAFRAAVPGALTPRFTIVGVSILVIWLVAYAVGLFSPSLEPSMLGKREHCLYETFLYALAPIAAAFFLTRRYYPLRPVYTALSFSIVAGMIPALYMQVACMYAPDHILMFHILPGLFVGVLGASLGLAYSKTKRASANH